MKSRIILLIINSYVTYFSIIQTLDRSKIHLRLLVRTVAPI